MNERERLEEIEATIQQLRDERDQLQVRIWKIDPKLVREKVRRFLDRSTQADEAAFKQLTYQEFVGSWQHGWMSAIQITDEVILDDYEEFQRCSNCSSGDVCAGHVYY